MHTKCKAALCGFSFAKRLASLYARMMDLLPNLNPGCMLVERTTALADAYLDYVPFSREFNAHKAAATAFVRVIECTKEARRAFMNGSKLSGFTLFKSALEAYFCLGAISVDPIKAMECMQRIHCKEYARLYKNLLHQGETHMLNGESIIELLQQTKTLADGLPKGPDSLFGLAELAGMTIDYKTGYKVACDHSHHSSLISAWREQLETCEDGRLIVKTNFKKEIDSSTFLPLATICIESIKLARDISAHNIKQDCREISIALTELEGEIEAAFQRFRMLS